METPKNMSTQLYVAFGILFVMLVLILQRIEIVEAIARDIKRKQGD